MTSRAENCVFVRNEYIPASLTLIIAFQHGGNIRNLPYVSVLWKFSLIYFLFKERLIQFSTSC